MNCEREVILIHSHSTDLFDVQNIKENQLICARLSSCRTDKEKEYSYSVIHTSSSPR